jgi:hypothetical protein
MTLRGFYIKYYDAARDEYEILRLRCRAANLHALRIKHSQFAPLPDTAQLIDSPESSEG